MKKIFQHGQVCMINMHPPAMYGLICTLTDDKLLAEEILMNAFLELKQKQTPSKIKYALLSIILRHTHSYTTKHLKRINLTPKTLKPPKEVELIILLTTQCTSLNEAAPILNITVKETKQRLHIEFLNLRMQNKALKNAPGAEGIYSESLLQI